MATTTEFRLLVLADPHVAVSPNDVAMVPPKRSPGLGLELLRRAIDDAATRGGFHAIALMGDILNEGLSPAAESTLGAVAKELQKAAKDVPLLVVPGNHDGDAGRLLTMLNARIGGHELAGYRFFVFADRYAEGDVCTRSPEHQQVFLDWAQESTSPIIVLQHNPMNPVIVDDYPYMLTNRTKVMADYARTGVALSLSGHYHKGQPATVVDGVTYFTAPAICERDFAYAIVTLQGRQASIETRTLKLPAELSLIDSHVHTEFAYCGPSASAAGAIERGRTIGLGGIRLVEHAPQLYCQKEDFWVGHHIRKPGLWRSHEHSRMARFREQMLPRRDDFVKIGLEVELDADGHLTLLEEDRWVDLLVGAIHFLKGHPEELSEAQFARLFLDTCQGLLANGVQVLAHPWRIFAWSKRKTPTDLYGELADMLAHYNVAAEVNFHGNWSDPAFFAKCVEKGVKIAFGSDAHELREVGSFQPHLDVLRQAAGTSDTAVLKSCLANI